MTGTNEKHTLIAYVEEALAKKDGAKILHVRDYENLKEFHEMKADAGPAADRTRALYQGAGGMRQILHILCGPLCQRSG